LGIYHDSIRLQNGAFPVRPAERDPDAREIGLEWAGFGEIDVMEMNEAFAAQSPAVIHDWCRWGVER